MVIVENNAVALENYEEIEKIIIFKKRRSSGGGCVLPVMAAVMIIFALFYIL